MPSVAERLGQRVAAIRKAQGRPQSDFGLSASVISRLIVLQTSWMDVRDAECLAGAGFHRREDGHCEARVRPSRVRATIAAFTDWMVRRVGGR